MARWNLAAFGMIALLFLGGLHLFSPPPATSADNPVGSDLAGRHLVVLAKDDVAFTLENVEIRQLGGRTFVVGRELVNSPYNITRERFGGSTVWIPIDAVFEMVEMAPKPGAK